MVFPRASLISQRWLSTMRFIRRNASTVCVLLVAGVLILRASSPVVSILTMRDLRWLCRTGALLEIAALAPNTATGGGSPPGPDAASGAPAAPAARASDRKSVGRERVCQYA